MQYNQAVRPLVYAALLIFILAFMGLDHRPILKKQESTLWALVLAMLYLSVLFVLGLFFGFGTNAMAPNMPVIVNNFLSTAPIFLLGNVIRYKLLKNVAKSEAIIIIAILTIAFSIVGLGEFRHLAQGTGIDFGEFIFASVFFAITLNLTVAYFAHKASFASVLIISGVYTLPPSLSPILPNILSFPWALISTIILGISLYVYIVFGTDKTKAQKYQENVDYSQHDSWIRQKLSLYNITTAGSLAVLIAFLLGAFNLYPVAVLTGSMTGTFDRGSMVLLQRIPEGEAYNLVEENSIIHFYMHDREYIHRVIEFDYNSNGERVFITKGDANEHADPWRLEQDAVIGIAQGSIPFAGFPGVAMHLLRGGS